MRLIQRFSVELAVACPVVLCGGCGAAQTDPSPRAPRNVLLVTFDTTRADRLGSYGYAEASTPTLDGLAASGVLFENCMAPAPITLPSHASILTGLYPHHHGVRNNGTHILQPDAVTLAEVFGARGFATGAVVSAAVLDARYGLDQGFGEYDDSVTITGGGGDLYALESVAEDTAQRARTWLDEHADEPFFLWVHFFDPHGDYEPPEAFAQGAASAYDGEISYADHGLGQVLDLLGEQGRLAETLVAFTADHGESLGEHGERTHALFVYESVIRVPLILTHPSLDAGRRVERVVSSVDLFPTLLDLTGLAHPANALDGHSLEAVAKGGAEPPERAAYAEAMYPFYNHGWSDLRSLRTDGFRYIRAPRSELYDLGADPGELVNLLEQQPSRAEALEALLTEQLAAGERDNAAGGADRLSDEVRAQMAALGYAWTDGVTLTDGRALPDPKDRLPAWSRFERAMALLGDGRLSEAAGMLRQLADEDPGAAMVHEQLGSALTGLGHKREALEVLRLAVQLPAVSTETRLLLARLENELGAGDWQLTLRTAQELDPRNPAVWTTEGNGKLENGDPTGALRAFERAVEEGGQFTGWKGIAQAQHALGNVDEVERALERVVGLADGTPEARFNLARLHESLGRNTRARTLYEKALEARPDYAEAALNLGNLHRERGRRALAEKLYRQALDSDPLYYFAHINLAVLLDATERSGEALEHLEVCMELRPSVTRPHLIALGIYRDRGSYGEVVRVADALLATTPNQLSVLLSAAVACHELGRGDAARQYLRRALAFDEERTRALAAEDVGAARLLSEMGGAGGD